MEFLIAFLIALAIFLAIIIPYLVFKDKYTKFVLNHSLSIKELEAINGKYEFNHLSNCDMNHSYDNENMYEEISPQDYLIYQLVYEQRKIENEMQKALENKNLYRLYINEIKEKCILNTFDTKELPRNTNRIKKIEKKLFNDSIKSPTINFSLTVELTLTYINGYYRGSKYSTFTPKDIKDFIYAIRQKQGNFYTNQEVWKSISKVERGKVTNKMRFAIYERDNHRCCKCGRRTDDLEIDHIIPIAKGGKSTCDNLQTLCHKCNYNKGSNVDYNH